MIEEQNENFLTNSIKISKKKSAKINPRSSSSHKTKKNGKFKIRSYPNKQKYIKRDPPKNFKKRTLHSPTVKDIRRNARQIQTQIHTNNKLRMSKIQFDPNVLEIGLYRNHKTETRQFVEPRQSKNEPRKFQKKRSKSSIKTLNRFVINPHNRYTIGDEDLIANFLSPKRKGSQSSKSNSQNVQYRYLKPKKSTQKNFSKFTSTGHKRKSKRAYMRTLEPNKLNIEHIFTNNSKDFEQFKNLLDSSNQNSADDEFETYKTKKSQSTGQKNGFKSDIDQINQHIDQAYKKKFAQMQPQSYFQHPQSKKKSQREVHHGGNLGLKIQKIRDQNAKRTEINKKLQKKAMNEIDLELKKFEKLKEKTKKEKISKIREVDKMYTNANMSEDYSKYKKSTPNNSQSMWDNQKFNQKNDQYEEEINSKQYDTPDFSYENGQNKAEIYSQDYKQMYSEYMIDEDEFEDICCEEEDAEDYTTEDEFTIEDYNNKVDTSGAKYGNLKFFEAEAYNQEKENKYRGGKRKKGRESKDKVGKSEVDGIRVYKNVKNTDRKKASSKKSFKSAEDKNEKYEPVQIKQRTIGKRIRKKPLDTGLGNLAIAKNRAKNQEKAENKTSKKNNSKDQDQSKNKSKAKDKLEKPKKDKGSKKSKSKKGSKNTITQSSKLKALKKKKKKKGAKMSELFPANMEDEKIKFYDSLKPYAYFVANEKDLESQSVAVPNPIQARSYDKVEYATYNPQFVYKFDSDSKVPFSEVVDKRFVSIAKRILDATLLYYSKDRGDRVIADGHAMSKNQLEKLKKKSGKNYFYKADSLYYNSFGRVVSQQETEREFRYYIEDLGIKFLTEEEQNYINQMKAKEELDMLSDITKVNDPYGRAISRGGGDYDSNLMKPKNMFGGQNDFGGFGGLNDQFTGFGPTGNDLFSDEQKLGLMSSNDPKEPKIVLQFSSKSIAPTKVVHVPKSLHSKIVVSLPVIYREKRLPNVLNHEIGTHYCRRYNDYFQFWYGKRNKYSLKGFRSTDLLSSEEGLASINQTYEQANSCLGYNWWSSNSENVYDINELTDVGFQVDPESDSYLKFEHNPTPPFLFQAALHYYAAYMSSILSFADLYNTLKRYMSDEVRLWRECIRVKRGQHDTSKSSGFYKDQVYLIGAIDILKQREKINFYDFYRGKICLGDYFKLFGHCLRRQQAQPDDSNANENGVEAYLDMGSGAGVDDNRGEVPVDGLLYPYFLKDIRKYRTILDKVAEVNFIDEPANE